MISDIAFDGNQFHYLNILSSLHLIRTQICPKTDNNKIDGLPHEEVQSWGEGQVLPLFGGSAQARKENEGVKYGGGGS